MSNEDEKKDSLFKSEHYYDLDWALTDFGTSMGAKETAVTAAKLVGKSLFNTVVFAGKVGLGVLKNAPAALEVQAERIKRENDRR